MARMHIAEFFIEGTPSKSAMGQYKANEVSAGCAYVQMVPQRGFERRGGLDLDIATMQHLFKMRRPAFLVQPKMWLVARGRRFDISSVRNLDEDDVMLELVCTERIPTKATTP